VRALRYGRDRADGRSVAATAALLGTLWLVETTTTLHADARRLPVPIRGACAAARGCFAALRPIVQPWRRGVLLDPVCRVGGDLS